MNTRRCGQCGVEIPDWSRGICPVCRRISQDRKRYPQTGRKRPYQVEAAYHSPPSRAERPKAKPSVITRRREVGVVRRSLGKRTRGRRRLDGFNQLLRDIYDRPVRFSHLLAKQGIPEARVERWRRDGIWLVRFLKRLKQELLVILAKAEPNHDPRVLNLWYGLDGESAVNGGNCVRTGSGDSRSVGCPPGTVEIFAG
jgi:hypothetical protein